MANIFLIDGNAVGFACHTGQKLSVGSFQTQAIFGIARTLRAMTVQHPSVYKAMLWDGRAQWRIDLYPDYKANREANPKMLAMREAYKAQRPYIERLVRALGVDQMRSPICEADDLASAYARLFAQKGKSVRLITADKDWLQLVTPLITWHDPIRDRIITASNFSEQTDFRNPEQILQHKCLVGDTSDNVKGVGGIGDVNARKLLAAYGTVEQMLRLKDEGKLGDIPTPWARLINNEDGRLDRYRLNRKLMSLTQWPLPGVQERQVTKGEYNPDTVRVIAEELAFHSILSDFDNWIQPFALRHK
jgi:5'-3' exonuclease